MNTEHFDVVVIGTGAGGGTLLHRLAPSGLRILVLERGDFLPRESENWDQHEVFVAGRYLAPERWLDADGKPFQPYTHYWVGGNTKVYGAALLRLRESDFRETRHFGGISPAWPIEYAELEPYYLEAERLYEVHGEAGADPTEPWRSGPFPFPPLPFEPRMAEIANGFREQGLRPFPCALGVRLRERDPEPRASRVLGRFDGYPDPTETKSDAEVVCVNPALRFPNVTLLTRAMARRLETDAGGRSVRTVVVERDGEPLRFSADLFVVACGAINSAALLLRSTSEKHPQGLANGSGFVGRNYMCHNNGMVIAISDEPNPSRFQKAFAIADFYHGADDSPRPLGLIQLMGKPDEAFLEDIARPFLPDVPRGRLWTRTLDFFITAEDLPDADNRVQLDASGSIRLHYRENNREAYDRLRAKLVGALSKFGCAADRCLHTNAYVGPKLGVSGVSHQSGTLRFGTDPRTSVLDRQCRAHELDNLYVTDSSFFPSSGAVNPSLTIMANALRVGDRILERLRLPPAGATR
ncbi:MAG: GMC family oxidoreductase [Planctomycetes bacterium]|nr:GMC family oxidoreductase [Planctomycetota bacterium]